MVDVPAGWYPDPSGRGQRWWDGTAWGVHEADYPAAAEPVVAEPDEPVTVVAPVESPVLAAVVEAQERAAAEAPPAGQSVRAAGSGGKGRRWPKWVLGGLAAFVVVAVIGALLAPDDRKEGASGDSGSTDWIPDKFLDDLITRGGNEQVAVVPLSAASGEATKVAGSLREFERETVSTPDGPGVEVEMGLNGGVGLAVVDEQSQRLGSIEVIGDLRRYAIDVDGNGEADVLFASDRNGSTATFGASWMAYRTDTVDSEAAARTYQAFLGSDLDAFCVAAKPAESRPIATGAFRLECGPTGGRGRSRTGLGQQASDRDIAPLLGFNFDSDRQRAMDETFPSRCSNTEPGLNGLVGELDIQLAKEQAKISEYTPMFLSVTEALAPVLDLVQQLKDTFTPKPSGSSGNAGVDAATKAFYAALGLLVSKALGYLKGYLAPQLPQLFGSATAALAELVIGEELTVGTAFAVIGVLESLKPLAVAGSQVAAGIALTTLVREAISAFVKAVAAGAAARTSDLRSAKAALGSPTETRRGGANGSYLYRGYLRQALNGYRQLSTIPSLYWNCDFPLSYHQLQGGLEPAGDKRSDYTAATIVEIDPSRCPDFRADPAAPDGCAYQLTIQPGGQTIELNWDAPTQRFTGKSEEFPLPCIKQPSGERVGGYYTTTATWTIEPGATEGQPMYLAGFPMYWYQANTPSLTTEFTLEAQNPGADPDCPDNDDWTEQHQLAQTSAPPAEDDRFGGLGTGTTTTTQRSGDDDDGGGDEQCYSIRTPCCQVWQEVPVAAEEETGRCRDAGEPIPTGSVMADYVANQRDCLAYHELYVGLIGGEPIYAKLKPPWPPCGTGTPP